MIHEVIMSKENCKTVMQNLRPEKDESNCGDNQNPSSSLLS